MPCHTDARRQRKPETRAAVTHTTRDYGRGYVLRSWDERKNGSKKRRNRVGVTGVLLSSSCLVSANHRKCECWEHNVGTDGPRRHRLALHDQARACWNFLSFFFMLLSTGSTNPCFCPCVRNPDFFSSRCQLFFEHSVQTRLRQKQVVEKNKGWLPGLLGPSAEPTVTRRQRQRAKKERKGSFYEGPTKMKRKKE